MLTIVDEANAPPDMVKSAKRAQARMRGKRKVKREPRKGKTVSAFNSVGDGDGPPDPA